MADARPDSSRSRRGSPVCRALLLWLLACCGGKDGADALVTAGAEKARAGQVAEAMNDFRAAIAADPNNAVAHYKLGLGHYEAGDYKAAVLSLGKAVALNPHLTDAYLALGNAYLKQD